MSLTSGGRKVDNSKDVLSRIVRAARLAAILGWNDMSDEYLPKIAMQDGDLRRGFRNVGLDIINTQRGSTNIRFSVNEIYSRLVNAVPYAEHHLEVGPTGLSFYINPNIPGTEPIKSAVFMPILNKHAQSNFSAQLRLAGLQLKRRS